MPKWIEKLHPRKPDGKFASKGGGGGGSEPRGYNRKERKARAATVRKNARAMGASRSTARAYGQFSKLEDKGKRVVAGDGKVYSVHRGDRKKVAAMHRQSNLAAAKKKSTKKK